MNKKKEKPAGFGITILIFIMQATPATLHSFLDNDFYKFTMQQCVIKLFPNAKARYRFINRGAHIFPPGFAEVLRQSVNEMAKLKLTRLEKEFFSASCPYLDPVYFDFLEGYTYDPGEVSITQKGGDIDIHIEGFWYRTILWEVPVLSLLSENYYLLRGDERKADGEVESIVKEKISRYNSLGVTVAEFGTRRRHSLCVHNLVVKALKAYNGKSFVGTSNVHLAMKYKTRPIGTHAHEWFMFHAAQFGFKMANSMALKNWVRIFRGDLGIALTDTYTSEQFFENFDKMYAKLFDGVRHDSGDPLEFADKTIKHYRKLGIDPLSKTVTFSDALNYEKVTAITEHCMGKIGFSFGIGTNFTNDVGLKPLNIVLKMTEALPENQEWMPVIKLSDEKGKHSGDERMISLCKSLLNISNQVDEKE